MRDRVRFLGGWINTKEIELFEEFKDFRKDLEERTLNAEKLLELLTKTSQVNDRKTFENGTIEKAKHIGEKIAG